MAAPPPPPPPPLTAPPHFSWYEAASEFSGLKDPSGRADRLPGGRGRTRKGRRPSGCWEKRSGGEERRQRDRKAVWTVSLQRTGKNGSCLWKEGQSSSVSLCGLTNLDLRTTLICVTPSLINLYSQEFKSQFGFLCQQLLKNKVFTVLLPLSLHASAQEPL